MSYTIKFHLLHRRRGIVHHEMSMRNVAVVLFHLRVENARLRGIGCGFVGAASLIVSGVLLTARSSAHSTRGLRQKSLQRFRLAP